MDFIYKKALLKLVKDKIEVPLASLDYSRSLDELLVEVDGYIDEYIVMGMEVVEDSLRQLYYDGVVDATIKLNQQLNIMMWIMNLWFQRILNSWIV